LLAVRDAAARILDDCQGELDDLGLREKRNNRTPVPR
jgi:hypothetical protein